MVDIPDPVPPPAQQPIVQVVIIMNLATGQCQVQSAAPPLVTLKALSVGMGAVVDLVAQRNVENQRGKVEVAGAGALRLLPPEAAKRNGHA